ncbi:MAG TPA: hypothetical protein DD420_34995 [Streptomyces sp.]|nr:hypothetical protein [Streptomyces sp.]
MTAPTPPRPQSVSELAAGLGAVPSTLWRALRSDPHAPAPADHDHRERPLYDPGAVTAWWPNRRRRGRPVSASPDSSPLRNPEETTQSS